MMRRPPISPRTDTLFPYTTLFRSAHPRPAGAMSGDAALRDWTIDALEKLRREAARSADTHLLRLEFDGFPGIGFYFKDEAAHPTGSLKHRLARDRKSTRLNSSH